MAKKRICCTQTGHRYRVSRRSAWWRFPERNFTASMEISINNPRCSGSFLECMLTWSSSRFQNFVFSIGDTLRVHNYINVGHPRHGRLQLPQAQEVALEEGNAWVRANRDLLDNMLGDTGYELIQWDKWKKHVDFLPYVSNLRQLFDTDTAFRKLILDDLRGYLARNSWSSIEIVQSNLAGLAEYVIEELAVYQIQAEQGDIVNIYPGGQMKVFKNAADIECLPESLRGRHYAYLDFSTESQQVTAVELTRKLG